MKTIILSLLLVSANFAQSSLLTLFDGIPDDRGDVANIMLNSGAKNTTDLVGANPNGFSINATYSVIVDGSNWLRIERLGSVNSYAGIQGVTGFGVGTPDNGEMFLMGHTYHIRIKYRSNGAAIRYIACGNASVGLTPINGTTIYEAEITAVDNSSLLFTFNGETDDSKYFEIDWIEVWE